jgi:SAM-dependent methyltransferase
MRHSEFDRYSDAYQDLLDDPIRNRFLAGQSNYFHLRKRDLVRAYFRKRGADSRRLKYLDLGCGKGELATLLRNDFAEVAGCDPSARMLEAATSITTRVQTDPGRIPFEDGSFDFATAVCVYHHVPVASRLQLTQEVRRVLSPSGIFCIIEHNPLNPVTRLIVNRTAVDADAVLLSASETRGLMDGAGFAVNSPLFFLYLPSSLYPSLDIVEKALARVPLGGQYAVFGRMAR